MEVSNISRVPIVGTVMNNRQHWVTVHDLIYMMDHLQIMKPAKIIYVK
jgi:hypothetical protein